MSAKTLLICVLIYSVLATICRAQCSTHHNDCEGCTALVGCGFCGASGECLDGGATGPSATGKSASFFGGCPFNWQYGHESHLIRVDKGFPVNPVGMDIFLKPNDGVLVNVEVTRPFPASEQLDLTIIQDASGSMGDDIQYFGENVPRIIAGVLANFKDSLFGFNSYVDKLFYNYATTRRDYTIQFNTPGLERRPSIVQIMVYKAIESVGYGSDRPEDPFSAIQIAATCNTLQKWRANSRKLIYMFTDADFHYTGAAYNRMSNNYYCGRQCSGSHGRYDEFCVFNRSNRGCSCSYASSCSDDYPSKCFTLNGNALGAKSWGQTEIEGVMHYHCPLYLRTMTAAQTRQCLVTETVLTENNVPFMGKHMLRGYDFVDLDHLGEALKLRNIFPILGTNSNYRSTYQSVVNGWGTGVALDVYSGGATAIVGAMLQSIETASSTITLIPDTTTTPSTATYATVEGTTRFTNVQILETVTFVVNFKNSNPQRVDLRLLVSGFNPVNVRIWDTVPCFGCDDVAHSGKIIDKCGVCDPAPEVKDICLGCDGVPYSGKVDDLCGICGGDSSSCIGCDGVVDSGKVLDECGVCGGDNTACAGCDGVPNSGAVYDICGVCDGDGSSCIGCDGVPGSGLVLDACGICGGNNACVGCDGEPRNPPLRNDSCGVCNGTNECVGCDGLLYPEDPASKPVYDICGVCGGDNTSCSQCINEDGEVVPYARYDDCGVCEGDNSTCYGCDGQKYVNPEEKPEFDICGICGGDNTTCLGCDGIHYTDQTPPVNDLCGVCGGNNSCLGCNKIPYAEYDRCNECQGNDECIACDGLPYFEGNETSKPILDACGECLKPEDYANPKIRDASCKGCDGVIFSGYTYDDCGQCLSPRDNRRNRDCTGCDEVVYPRHQNGTYFGDEPPVFDVCGVCGGNGSTCVTVQDDVISEAIPAVVGIASAVLIGIIIAVIAAIAIASVQTAANGIGWLIPQDVFGAGNAVGSNPLYKGESERTNQLFQD